VIHCGFLLLLSLGQPPYTSENTPQLKKQESQAAASRVPAMADVSYGPHARNKLDYYRSKAPKPAPVVLYIHGGGFVGGDKRRGLGDTLIDRFLESGIHYVSINYRLRDEAPIQEILRDTARAVQFLRYDAERFGIDKRRIAVFGSSAGAGAALWLAFHDDLADAKSSDPVLRESSRVSAAGVIATQFSYDLEQWEDVLGVPYARFYTPDPGFYGFKSMDEAQSAAGRKVRADVDMRGLISKEDPPVILYSRLPDTEPKDLNQLNHHPRHAMAIERRMKELGLSCEMYLPGDGGPAEKGHEQLFFAFLRRYLEK